MPDQILHCALLFNVRANHQRFYVVGSTEELRGHGMMRAYVPPRDPELRVRQVLSEAGIEFAHIGIFGQLINARVCMEDVRGRTKGPFPLYLCNAHLTHTQRILLEKHDFDVAAKHLADLAKILPATVSRRAVSNRA